MVKKCIIVSFLLTICAWSYSQTINFERQNLGRFVQRMYENAPFEGVQLMDTGKTQYVVAVFSLDEDAYPNAASMNRVANVKANSMVSKYLNGSQITSALVLSLKYDKDSLIVNKTATEQIREVSAGMVKSVEIFASFKYDGLTVFVFGKEINTI